ncbi:MAG: site-specific DNA-methyltransferase [Treponema sp.]|nr:site-specific DNA-methyltransferase [Treponema sp.]
MISLSWTDYSENFDDVTLAEKACFITPEGKPSDLKADSCGNLMIEGDNYPVLQKISKDFEGKIHFIYIDPPYNTGNNFTYEDDFSVLSQDSASGSSRVDKHSAWLSFMKRRLQLAKDMLSEKGCIFIAIDQSELYTLKLLCDQIFGEENFVNDFMWLHGKGKKDRWSRTLQQHTLCYARFKAKLPAFREIENSNWAHTNADDDPRGKWFSGSISFNEKRSNPNHKNFYSITSPGGRVWTRQWLVTREEMDSLLADKRIFFGKAPQYSKVPRVKIFNDTESEVIPRNIIESVETTRAAQKHLDKLLGVKGAFDNPKPVNLIKHLMKICGLPKDALVLDFFAGSGTTFEALCSLNSEDGGRRKCILVQKAEPTYSLQTKKSPRKGCEAAFNAGYMTIADLCWERCCRTAKEYGAAISRLNLVFDSKSD